MQHITLHAYTLTWRIGAGNTAQTLLVEEPSASGSSTNSGGSEAH